MRVLAVFLFCLACDHSPAPGADPDPTAQSRTPRPATVATCEDVAVHLAEVLINSSELSARAAYEQDRTKLVKRSAENCQAQGWSAASRRCFVAAKTSEEIQRCTKDLAAELGAK